MVHLDEEDRARFMEAISLALASLKDGRGLKIRGIYGPSQPEKLRQAHIAALEVFYPGDVEGGEVYPDRVDLSHFLKMAASGNSEPTSTDAVVSAARPERRLTIRVPSVLADRMEALAEEKDCSLNTLAMRCFEKIME